MERATNPQQVKPEAPLVVYVEPPLVFVHGREVSTLFHTTQGITNRLCLLVSARFEAEPPPVISHVVYYSQLCWTR